MKVDILTREYPPHVYGGAGVHAEELSKVLAERIDVTVRAFDGKRTEADIPAIPNAANAKGNLKVVGYDTPSELADANPALKTFGVDLQIANDVDADIIHAHTWYACLAGYLAKMLHGTPLVITAHSLEPFRPWKREQLGGGYNLSSWGEKEAYENADRVIAVSGGMRKDILTAYPTSIRTRWLWCTTASPWPTSLPRHQTIRVGRCSSVTTSTVRSPPCCSWAVSPARRACHTCSRHCT